MGEHRVHLAIVGAATAIGLGGVLFRKRRSTADVSRAEDPPAAAAPVSPAPDESPSDQA